jgi:hypothetical protein
MFHPTDSIAQEIPAERPAAEPFFLLPRNRDFYLGKARYPAIKDRSLFFFLVLTEVVALVFFGSSVREAYIVNQIAQYGQITTGTVISRYISRGKSTSYYMTYTFQAALPGQAARSYQYEQTVSQKNYNQHPEGSKVRIAYFPNDPTMSRLGGPDRDDGSTFAYVLVMAIGTLTVTAFLAYQINQVLRDREFAGKGHIIEGQLLDRQGAMTGGKNKYFRLDVAYRFVSPQGGQEITGRQSTPRNDLKGKKKLPRPGVPVVVLYVDDKHYKML